MVYRGEPFRSQYVKEANEKLTALRWHRRRAVRRWIDEYRSTDVTIEVEGTRRPIKEIDPSEAVFKLIRTVVSASLHDLDRLWRESIDVEQVEIASKRISSIRFETVPFMRIDHPKRSAVFGSVRVVLRPTDGSKDLRVAVGFVYCAPGFLDRSAFQWARLNVSIARHTWGDYYLPNYVFLLAVIISVAGEYGFLDWIDRVVS